MSRFETIIRYSRNYLARSPTQSTKRYVCNGSLLACSRKLGHPWECMKLNDVKRHLRNHNTLNSMMIGWCHWLIKSWGKIRNHAKIIEGCHNEMIGLMCTMY